MKRTEYVSAALVVLVWLAGCSSESRDVTMHKPGVYKGTQDPLLARQGQQELANRFKLVQADR